MIMCHVTCSQVAVKDLSWSLKTYLSLCPPVCLQVRNNPKRSCQFNRTMLGDCSGMADRFYGYDRGQPCVLIKLNRVGGLETSS